MDDWSIADHTQEQGEELDNPLAFPLQPIFS